MYFNGTSGVGRWAGAGYYGFRTHIVRHCELDHRGRGCVCVQCKREMYLEM